MISPADRALLLACRVHLDDATADRLAGALREVRDWDCLVRQAVAHGVAGLLSRHLRALPGNGSAPEAALADLLTLGRATALRNARLMAQAAEILRAAHGAGLRVMPLKGIALLDGVYHDRSLRPMADLDLLVPPDELRPAAALLAGLGYAIDARYPGTRRLREMLLHELQLTHAARAGRVDLHRRLVPLTGAGTARLWRAAGPRDCAGAPAWAMDDVDRLVYLAAHLHRHGWDSLSRFCDIAECVRAGGIDAERLVERARAAGAAAATGFALWWVREHLGASAPAGAAEALCPRAPEIGRALRRGDSPVPDPASGPAERLKRQLPLLDGRVARAVAGARHAARSAAVSVLRRAFDGRPAPGGRPCGGRQARIGGPS
ncbi:MAG: nucleotidyltransferase family protein [Chthonomonadales bacterium]|nr:nucleotidyltransferase family protein [Chthonomonadales bacterium]